MSLARPARRTRRALSLMVAAAGLAALAPHSASAAPKCTAADGIRTCTFSFIRDVGVENRGRLQTWVVPSDVDGELTIVARGGAGKQEFPTPGGRPAEVTARTTLPAGTTLAAVVDDVRGRAQLDQVIGSESTPQKLDPSGLLNNSLPLVVAGGGGSAGVSRGTSGGAGGDAGLPGVRAQMGGDAPDAANVGGGGGGEGAFSGIQGLADTFQPRQPGARGLGGVDLRGSGDATFSPEACSIVTPGTPGAAGTVTFGATGGPGGDGGDGYTGGGEGGTGATGAACLLVGGSTERETGHGGGGGGSSFVDQSLTLVDARVVDLTNAQPGTLSVSYRIAAPSATITPGSTPGDFHVVFGAGMDGFGTEDLLVELPDGTSVRLNTIPGVTITGEAGIGTIFSGGRIWYPSYTVSGVVSALRAAGYGQTGAHTITIADTGARLATFDGSPPREQASFSWAVPTVSIVGAPTTPAFTPADDVRIVPSSEISGLGVEDLRLLRDDVVVPLDGVSVDFVITFTGTYYKVSGLGALTAAPGEYTLTVDATGLTDTLGNPLLGAQRVIWQNRRLLATLDVPTTPQTTGVGTIPVLFNRAVSGLDVGDFALVRRGVSSDVCGDGFCPAGAEVTISGTVTGADTDWQLNGLADETAGEGVYTLTLNDNLAPVPLRGVADGVNVEVPTSATFVVDFAAPTAAITRSADPPVGAGDIVSVRFSEPVNGFDIADVTLTRDGTPVDLTDIVGFNPIRELNILNTTGVLTPQGTYVLTVAPGGITDQRAGRPFAGATSTWTVNDAPTGTFGTLSPADTAAAGRTTPVSSVPVTFSEEVVGFDAADLVLTRGGQPVALTGVTVSGSGTTYTVDGLGAVTAVPGAYALSIRTGSGIRDLSSTDLSGTPSVAWTLQNLTAVVGIGAAPAVTEGSPPTGGALRFPITLDRPVSGDVRVAWGTTIAGTATAGLDFLASTGTVVIPAGSTRATVSVPVIADTRDEPEETVQVRISSVTGNAVLGTPATATGTITDDDPTPTVSVGDARITEGRSGLSTVRIPVSIATPGARTVSITWSTRNVTARAGRDYRARIGQILTIPAGATTATLSVPVFGDRTREADETFEVVIESIRRGAIADGTGIVTIVNDD